MVLGWLVLGGLGVATWQRNTVYGSETAFWSDVATKSPRNARAWNNLGYALEREHPARPLSALRAYERALMLDPADFKAYFNRQRLCSREQLRCAAPPPG
jgi:Flp pilus assembly protein TadD